MTSLKQISRRLSGVLVFTTLFAAGMSLAGTTPPIPDAQKLNDLLSPAPPARPQDFWISSPM